MYSTLLSLHSLFRWVALIAMVYATTVAIQGYFSKGTFTTLHNRLRHWSATMLHIQLTIGFLLYFASPIISWYWSDGNENRSLHDGGFFAVVHLAMMLVAVVLATFGSASAKRKTADIDKFRTMAVFYSIALLIILLAIPWPFSPLTARPLIRTF